jgi:hypothetical protein
MNRCRGTRRNGERCTQTVEPPNAYCWHHAPERAEERRRAASRAGKSRPSTEVRTIKEEIKGVISGVKAGEIDRNDAAVMIQGYRTLKDFIALERGIRVEDELAAEIEELKRERGHAS